MARVARWPAAAAWSAPSFWLSTCSCCPPVSPWFLFFYFIFIRSASSIIPFLFMAIKDVERPRGMMLKRLNKIVSGFYGLTHSIRQAHFESQKFKGNFKRNKIWKNCLFFFSPPLQKRQIWNGQEKSYFWKKKFISLFYIVQQQKQLQKHAHNFLAFDNFPSTPLMLNHGAFSSVW